MAEQWQPGDPLHDWLYQSAASIRRIVDLLPDHDPACGMCARGYATKSAARWPIAYRDQDLDVADHTEEVARGDR